MSQARPFRSVLYIPAANARALEKARDLPADAIIFATAQAHGAQLLTCDAHFDGLPGVMLVPKVKG